MSSKFDQARQRLRDMAGTVVDLENASPACVADMWLLAQQNITEHSNVATKNPFVMLDECWALLADIACNEISQVDGDDIHRLLRRHGAPGWKESDP
jgi:hypothetical protein